MRYFAFGAYKRRPKILKGGQSRGNGENNGFHFMNFYKVVYTMASPEKIGLLIFSSTCGAMPNFNKRRCIGGSSV